MSGTSVSANRSGRRFSTARPKSPFHLPGDPVEQRRVAAGDSPDSGPQIPILGPIVLGDYFARGELGFSFSLVPFLFKYLMASQFHAGHGSGHSAHGHGNGEPPRRGFNPFGCIHRSFERGILVLRVIHRNALAWMVDQPIITVSVFGLLVAASR